MHLCREIYVDGTNNPKIPTLENFPLSIINPTLNWSNDKQLSFLSTAVFSFKIAACIASTLRKIMAIPFQPFYPNQQTECLNTKVYKQDLS